MSPGPKERPSQREAINPINHVLVVDRGEMALRGVRAAISSDRKVTLGVADQDWQSLAAEATRGAGEVDGVSSVVPLMGDTIRSSLGHIPSILTVADGVKADAVFVGYGTLAEDAKAAKQIKAHGLEFVGPDPEVIAIVGDKIVAKEWARRARLPLIPGSEDLKSVNHAREEARRLGGFPFMLKASDSGGGAGNIRVDNKEMLEEAYGILQPAFERIYLEKYIEGAVHIEVQIVGDKRGNVVALGERDCSSQREFQKVVEETPAPNLPETVRKKMVAGAIRMAKKLDYHSLGTWEFLYDPKSKKHYFMEINPRIQVEHTVTEERFGLNLVDLQYRIAEGRKLPEIKEIPGKFVMEARLYAENPDFSAASGTLSVLNIPEVDGVRVDRGYREGGEVPSEFDSTIAKFIATGSTREEARVKLVEALGQLEVTGVPTNREFLIWLLGTEGFRDGKMSITSVEEAWSKYQRGRFPAIESIIGNEGAFTEMRIKRHFDPSAFPQDLHYTKRGKEEVYSEQLSALHEQADGGCAYRYGTYYHPDYGEIVLGFWDKDRMNGTFGAEEGDAMVESVMLAHKRGLAMAIIYDSPGARQQENSLAQIQMPRMVAAFRDFPVSAVAHIINRYNFGGLMASIASGKDFRFGVDGGMASLTGPDIVAQIEGLKDRTELPEGALTVASLYANRNLDLIVGSPEEAIKRFLGICSTLKLSDSALGSVFHTRDFDSTTGGTLFNRPESQRFPARVSSTFGSIFHRGESRRGKNPLERAEGRLVPSTQLTPEERFNLVQSPYRPSPWDILKPGLVFDDVSPLSLKHTMERTEQHPTVIAAIATRNGIKYMVIAQQTQRTDEEGELQEIYVPQSPRDLRWGHRWFDFAEKIPDMRTLLIADSMGADGSLQSEVDGINNELFGFYDRDHTLRTKLYTVNWGINASGGAGIFSVTGDYSADVANGMTVISGPDVMHKILMSKWRLPTEPHVILPQLADGTAEKRLLSHQIDFIIPEPIGGAQADWTFMGKGLGDFLDKAEAATAGMSLEELHHRRSARLERAGRFATRPVK